MATHDTEQHSMHRRAFAHNYSQPGIYHITLHVADGMGQPLGAIAGRQADEAHVSLTPGGKAVEHELLTAINAHYPMITVDTYIIMPEHLHFILKVSDIIHSQKGRTTHLGQVMAGFKTGCNRAYWAATDQQQPPAAGTAIPPAAGTAQPPAAGTAIPPEAGPAIPPAAKPQGTLPAASSVAGGFAASSLSADHQAAPADHQAAQPAPAAAPAAPKKNAL